MLLCTMFGHKFFYKFGGALSITTQWESTDFCTRCGIPKGES